jgi:hypothetical protein
LLFLKIDLLISKTADKKVKNKMSKKQKGQKKSRKVDEKQKRWQVWT